MDARAVALAHGRAAKHAERGRAGGNLGRAIRLADRAPEEEAPAGAS
jgi:hypothetical protein